MSSIKKKIDDLKIVFVKKNSKKSRREHLPFHNGVRVQQAIQTLEKQFPSKLLGADNQHAHAQYNVLISGNTKLFECCISPDNI